MKAPTIFRLKPLLIGCLLALLGPGEVLATLGQTPMPQLEPALTAPAWPGAKKLALAPARASNLYSLHESQLASGTTIREFASPAGLVFALSWRGPVLPDLGALLGDYFKTFEVGVAQARVAGRRGSPVSVQSDQLVVQSSGRMGNFYGYAYAPALIPGGVKINDVLE